MRSRQRQLASRLHLLLASLALGAGGAAAACGGIVERVDDGQSADAGKHDAQQQQQQGDDDVDTDDGGFVEHGPDGSIVDGGRKDASHTYDASTPDVFTGCATGVVDADPALCCATQDPPLPSGCVSSNGGDQNQCALDCNAVCERVAPGSSTSGGFADCYWTASASDPQIGYACGQCGVGRIPSDTVPCPRGDSVAERLAAQAYYEAASVIAFDRLARELERFGAPEELIARVRAASADESRHAATFEDLAATRGGRVTRPARRRVEPSLLELAVENATEGCVREAYGALVALHQAEHAEDPELRAAFARVAEEEIAHAELSLDLADWFDTQLDAEARYHVQIARTRAERDLGEAVEESTDEVDAALGLPTPPVAKELYARLFGEVLPSVRAA